MWGICVIVPKKLQSAVLQELHQNTFGNSTNEEGGEKLHVVDKHRQRHRHLVKNCRHCQVVQNATVAPLHPWIWPSEPWR